MARTDFDCDDFSFVHRTLRSFGNHFVLPIFSPQLSQSGYVGRFRLLFRKHRFRRDCNFRFGDLRFLHLDCRTADFSSECFKGNGLILQIPAVPEVYLITIFTRRFGTTIIFTICLPSVYSFTLSLLKANSSKSFCDISGETTTRTRSLPFI